MKEKVNNAIDWFENHFNFVIDIAALVGGVFIILLSILLFILLIFGLADDLEFLNYIAGPGFAGVIGIFVLFALRITRHITRDNKE